MKSMTGFGSAEARTGATQLTVEVRSVNHRNLDVKISAPREYARWESELRRAVAAVVTRGRVEVYVSRGAAAGSRAVSLQRDVAAAYIRAWKELKREFKLAGEVELGLLQTRSDLFQPRDDRADVEAEIETTSRLLSRALAAHAREREREGAHLKRDMQSRVRVLHGIARKLDKRVGSLSARLRERLEKRLSDLIGRDIDPARLAQEVALLVERSDVTEELVRLASHLDSMGELLSENDPVGKRIDFLLQEIQREINTIGSKASDLDTTRLVLEGKAEVEKMREQVQNVE